MALSLQPLSPEDAIAALAARKPRLAESFSWEDFWQEDHAQMFTVAKSAGFDILNDIYDALLAALKDGKTIRDFSRELKPVLQAKGWWGRRLIEDPATGDIVPATLGSTRRLQTIFDTNMRVSYAAGHWTSFERNRKARPYLRYVALLDERTRPAHRLRHNLVLPIDHPYWNTWAPPCGWNCRCTLQSLSERDIRRLRAEGEQLQFEPPQDSYRDYVNRRTGEVVKVPDGIDPGWAYNPGKAGWKALQLGRKLIEAPPDIASAAGSLPTFLQRPTSKEFPDWFDTAAAGGPLDPTLVVAGVLDPAVLAVLRARGLEPSSAAITLTQQTVRHMMRDAKSSRETAVPPDLLKRIPDLLAQPVAILRDRRDGALLYVFDVEGETRLGKLVVRIDFQEKTRTPEGRTKVVSNAIRTAGLVDIVTLRDKAVYDVLTGEL